MKYSQKELCLIWLDAFTDLAYKHKWEIYNLIDGKRDIKSVIERAKDYLITQIGETAFSNLIKSANPDYLQSILEGLEKRGVRAITIHSDDYPDFLTQVELPPLVIYAKGDVDLFNAQCFGVVGSRKSLPLQKNIAKTISDGLIDNGFILVTGIAEGIDQTVLECAIEKGAKVISVVAGGFDNIYPKTNLELFEKVAKQGLVISEQPPEVIPKPYMFPVRNRIISALSDGVLIVSAGKRSGTLWTANYAEEYSKKVFAVPYSPGIASGEGCNELIKQGALLCDNVQDILTIFGKIKEKQQLTLSEEEREIILLLREGETHIQKICEKLGKKIFEITPVLSIMEINGLVYKNGSNVYGTNADLEV